MTADYRTPSAMADATQDPTPAPFRFLHSVDLLDDKTLEGEADWRGREEALLGGQRLWGQRVVELYPSSAWLSAHVAARCNDYVALDRPAPPDGVRSGWQHVMHALGLTPTIVGDGAQHTGGYDVALLFGALSRAANPLELIETAAALSDDMLLVIEPACGEDAGAPVGPQMTMLPDTVDPYRGRWELSRALLERLLAQAGFPRQVATRHEAPGQAANAGTLTIVARRSGRRAPQSPPPHAPGAAAAASAPQRSPDLDAAEDLPLPPPADRRATTGTPDVEVFVTTGRHAFETMAQALGRNGVAVPHLGRVLDFGCGVSRVLRWWRMVPGVELHGTDIDVAAVTWNRERLGYGNFTINTLDPRLDHPAGSFGLVYALGVFNHLPENLQVPWFRELLRVIRPGGHLYLTTRGRSCRALLPPDLQAVFDAHRIVSGGAEQAGTPGCVTFHPPQWVANTLPAATGAEVAEVVEWSLETPGEDCWLLRKPLAG